MSARLPIVPRLSLATLATLALGALGGGLFFVLGLPLPWMLGAILVVFVAVMAGAPLEGPDNLRPFVIPVIGVMLGSGFDTDTFGNLLHWGLSLLGLTAYIGIAALLVVPLYMKVGRLDPYTAFFSAMPGGINEMMVIGEAMGGDAKRIILAHAARIVLSISIIAFWFRVVLGYEVSGIITNSDPTAALTWASAGILLICAVAGSWFGTLLRLPAPGLLGPLMFSAVAHMVGITHSSPPVALIIAAQIIMGATMGCRFRGASGRLVAQTVALSFGGTTIMLAVTLAAALAFHTAFGQTTEQVILAYAPGGLTEMSLVALAMEADVAYISIHHLVRIVILIAIAPTLLTRIAKRLAY
ncbi:AbrB family transcriptional regulator [Celeribacter arenosi]|uniref:AbrB family transcriptional regulator n=1 Tax=Celeribacter arenosi TaxID=792649 RepID=A0ABP7K626_9RHOB